MPFFRKSPLSDIQTKETRAHNIRYYVSGKKYTRRVLFLHGIWMPPRAYRGIWQLEGVEVVAPYFIGAAYLGERGRWKYSETLELMNELIADLNEEEGHKETVVVGHSAGGLLALSLVGQPGLERALSLNPALNYEVDPRLFFERNGQMILKTPFQDVLALPTDALLDFVGNTVNGYVWRDMIEDWVKVAVEFPHPGKNTIIYSDNDSLIREEEFLKGFTGQGDLLCYRGAEHGWVVFEPERLRELVSAFLEEKDLTGLDWLAVP